MEKKEVEGRLGMPVSDELFGEALEYAERKQEYIYRQGRNPLVMQPWYLLELTVGYIRSLVFSEITLKICRELGNMEKEHPAKNQSAQMDSHIVTVPAL